MRAASHAVCFEWPGEPGCGGVLSTGVYGCSWFSFGFAVSFAVRVFLLAAHWCFVWISNGKLWTVTGDFSKTHQRVEKPLS